MVKFISAMSLNKLILAIAIFMAATFIYEYGGRTNVFHGDFLGYYMYLPATFIYHNLDTPNQLPADKRIEADIFSGLDNFKQTKTPTGKVLDQYTYGVALLQLPFFLLAHAYEKLSGLPANGYSTTYVVLVKIADLFYALLGLLLIYSILRHYFSKTVSFFAVILLFTGTNLFWFAVHQPGMCHVPLFFLYALLLRLTMRIHLRPSFTLFAAIGLTCGLITIIRPVDVVCLLVPLLYSVYNGQTLRRQAQFLATHKVGIALMVLAFILPILPQMAYWKAITGHYVYYSYGDQQFDFAHPKIIEGLFYYSNGWLAYSPLMIFSVAGLFFYKHIKPWAWCLWLLFPVYTYVIYSWYCYNYINGLGSRPMVDIYPLLAIPLAAFLQFVSRQRLWAKSAAAVVCVFFVSLNLCYSMQQQGDIILSEDSNMAFTWQMLYRMHLTYNDLVVHDTKQWQPDTTKLTRLCTLARQDYEDSTSVHFVKDTVFGGRYVYQMHDEEYAEAINMPYDHNTFKDATWVKCSGWFMCPVAPDYCKHIFTCTMGNAVRECKIENKIGTSRNGVPCKDITLEHWETGRWGYIYYFAKIPHHLHNGDRVKLYVRNTGRRPLYMDDLCLELYK